MADKSVSESVCLNDLVNDFQTSKPFKLSETTIKSNTLNGIDNGEPAVKEQTDDNKKEEEEEDIGKKVEKNETDETISKLIEFYKARQQKGYEENGYFIYF